MVAPNSDLDGATLLARYNPLLVLFPQDPARRWPGAWRPGDEGWGDYHPCTAEFVLDRVRLRKVRPAFSFFDYLRPSHWRWSPLPRTGIDAIQNDLQSDAARDASHGWEVDVADIPSQTETVAWEAYGRMLDESQHPFECVAYGRFVPGLRPTLQYWYLYMYDDFVNNHEADWEMATIELTPDGEPVQMGLSSHFAGAKWEWPYVQKVSGKPVVYVALGSHACYFKYLPKGYKAKALIHKSNLPSWLGRLARAFRHFKPLQRVRDLPPARKDFDAPDPKLKHEGVDVPPTLRVLPESVDQAPDAEFWWLRYRGKWGSTRPRFWGAVGIDSPWHASDSDERWSDPPAWLDSLPDDTPK